VADGDDIARFTCLDMFFHFFFIWAPVESLQICKLSTLGALLAFVLDILDSCVSLLAIILGLNPWHFVTLEKFYNPSSGG
jgi:hypothetical protein